MSSSITHRSNRVAPASSSAVPLNGSKPLDSIKNDKNDRSRYSNCCLASGMICIGALVGIATGLLIALQVTSTKNGTERLKKYSEQLHNMSMGTIWNTPLVSLPEANSRAIPPADLNWIKKVETLQAFRGLRKEDYGVVIPEYIQQQQEGKASCDDPKEYIRCARMERVLIFFQIKTRLNHR